MCKSPICGVISGIVLFNAVQLSCAQEHDIAWAIDEFLQDEFVIYTTVDSIPEPIINAIPKTSDRAITVMVDPGEDYNVTDIIDYPDLPFSRLIFAGQSDKIWFVYSEEGGIGFHIRLLLYEYSNGQVVLRNELVFFQKAPDLDGLRQLIVSAKEISITGFTLKVLMD
ncbi:MAG: hypothetical protein OXG98_01420 [Gemmatimonadetes bacterium]|nr:hypothetical protein [Gemmatimonadota bacterium]